MYYFENKEVNDIVRISNKELYTIKGGVVWENFIIEKITPVENNKSKFKIRNIETGKIRNVLSFI